MIASTPSARGSAGASASGMRLLKPDALVVGAGVTGMAVATELARHGIVCRVIDRQPAPPRDASGSADPRAGAQEVQPLTQEIFADMGIREEVTERAQVLRSMNLYTTAQAKRIARVEYGAIGTPFPHVLGVAASDVVAALRGRFEQAGLEVDHGTELTALEQRGEHEGVRATLRGRDGFEEVVQARWLIGCDGADSRVRERVRVAADPLGPAERYWVADVELDWEMPEDDQYIFLASGGFFVLTPLPGERRALAIADVAASESAAPTLEGMQRLFARRVHIRGSITRTRSVVCERIQRLVVRRYRVGPVFLAGDAAHVYGPLGGQGMNAGLQDAYNLGWKLGLVKRGLARPRLLDTYGEERRQAAEFARGGTERAGRALRLRGSLAKGLRDTLGSLLAGVGGVNRRIAALLSERDFGYRGSSLVEEHHTPLLGARLTHSDRSEQASLGDRQKFGQAPDAGARVPHITLPDGRALWELLAGTFHTLLLFDGQAPTAEGYRNLSTIAKAVRDQYGDLVRVHVVVPARARPGALTWDGPLVLDTRGELHRRFGAAAECQYLVRPDGYIAFRSQPAERDVLLRYLSRLFV